MRTIVYDSDLSGRFEIYLKNLDINNAAVGAPMQVTNAGAVQQEAQEPQYSLVASANATTNPDFLGRIVYQFGTSGDRGLHLTKPLAYASNLDVQLTPQPLNGRINAGPLAGKLYPCTDARDPAWSPDGTLIVYSCFEQQSTLAALIGGTSSNNGTNPTGYDLWIHDTHGTPDDPRDDSDYPLLTLSGPLALQPTWSPDGTMIAFMTNAPGQSATGSTPKIGLIAVPNNLGSGLSVLYGAAILTDDAFNNVAPAWDPGSGFIAFSTNRTLSSGGGFTNAGNRTIWTMNTAGQIIAQITGTNTSTANDTHPSWPGSNVMYFQSDRSNGNNSWLINPATPEDLGGSVLQVTGVPGDSAPDAVPAHPLQGIDISNSALAVDFLALSAALPPIPGLGVGLVVVDLYGGVDGGANPSCTPTLFLHNTFPDPNCTNTYDVQNLIGAQGVYPTGAFIELSFVPNSQKQYQAIGPPGTGYGTHAVDYAAAAIGSTAWNNLNFVAIAVEYADGVTDANGNPYIPWGTPCQQVDEVVNAIKEVDFISKRPINTIIYTNKTQWNGPNHLFLGFCSPLTAGQMAYLQSHQIWEATSNGSQSLKSKTSLPFGPWTKNQRVGNQYWLDNRSNLWGIPDVDLDIFDPSILIPPLGSTGVGTNLMAPVVNTTTGIGSLAVTFSNATQAGVTTASSSTTGPAPPSGFRIGTPATYFDVTTTALFTGSVLVCVDYVGISFGSQSNLALFHYENGAWVDRTVSVDTVNHTICASVSSFSPFAIFEQGTLATPVVTITGGTFSFDNLAHAATANVTGVSGGPVSGSFTFTYAPGGSSPPVNVGTYSVTALFTSADPSYTNATSTGTITINPSLQTSTTTTTGSMQFARVSHQATLLANGSVLISGGQGSGTPIPQSEVYNPVAGTWTLSGSNVIPRFDHSATVLRDGRVLAAGGVISNGDCSLNVTAETYDPSTGIWSLTGRLPFPVGTGHAAVRLLDGRVLVSGGGDRCGNVFHTAQIFDPSSNKWSATGNLNVARQFHSAALLSDGRVLVAGGMTSSTLAAVPSAEVYDPATGNWTAVGSMTTARQTSCNGYTQTFLGNLLDGTVLAAGGFAGSSCPAITPQRTVTGLTVNPTSVQLTNIGQTQALAATAQMSDGTTEPFTGPLQFSSTNTTIAAVDASGLITGVGTGTTTLTVTAPGIAPVSVTTTIATRNLTSITVSPAPITFIGPGQTQPLAVNGLFSDGSQQALTTGVTFTSSNAAVAGVDATGLITSGANGTATITATATGAQPVQVPVLVKSLVSIAASPASISLAIGQAQGVSVTGQFSDGSQQILTGTANFLSADPTIARVDLGGNVTAINSGNTTITVTVPNLAAVQVTVKVVQPPVLVSVNPSTGQQGQQNLSVALTGQFTNWVQGTTTANFGAGVTVASLTVNSSTSATAVVNIDSAAITGTRNVVLTTGSEVDTLANAFGVAAAPDLTIAKSHSGNFSQGQAGAAYTITVTNSGTAPTVGTITVTDTLPAGLTAIALSGTSWACTLSTLTCTRSDILADSASYPAITLTVNVAGNAPAAVTNTAVVSGGGEVNTQNDTASDVTSITQISACAVPPSGLIHWWPGDGNANDIVGGDDGTLQNGATFGQGEVGYGFSLNGAGAINIPAASDMNLTSVTLEAWILMNTPPPVANAYAVATKGIGTSTENYGLYITSVGSTMELMFEWGAYGSGTGNHQVVSMGSSLTSGVLHHIAATADGANVTFYVDGKFVSQLVQSLPLVASAGTFQIGSDQPTLSNQFDGIIDEFSLYNRALLQSEIQAIYTAGNLGKCRPPSQTYAISGLPFSIVNSASPAAGPQTYTISGLPFSIANSTSPAAGPQTYTISGLPFSIMNSTSPAAGPQTYTTSSLPFSIMNSTSPAAGPQTYTISSLPFSIVNSTSPAAGPQTYMITGLPFSIFNSASMTLLTQSNLMSRLGSPPLNGLSGGVTSASTASLHFWLPLDPSFVIEALARGAQRIDGKPLCTDSDNDGLCDTDELIIGTNPYSSDTDGDGYPDGLEVLYGSDPLNPASIPMISQPGYYVTAPVSILNSTPIASLTPRRQGAIYAKNNR